MRRKRSGRLVKISERGSANMKMILSIESRERRRVGYPAHRKGVGRLVEKASFPGEGDSLTGISPQRPLAIAVIAPDLDQ